MAAKMQVATLLQNFHDELDPQVVAGRASGSCAAGYYFGSAQLDCGPTGPDLGDLAWFLASGQGIGFSLAWLWRAADPWNCVADGGHCQ